MPSVSDLDAHTGYSLRMASNAVSQEFAHKLAREDVTVAKWAMRRLLYEKETIAPSVLAERMDMTSGTNSKLAGRLLEKELIRRDSNPGDRRAHSLFVGCGRERQKHQSLRASPMKMMLPFSLH